MLKKIFASSAMVVGESKPITVQNKLDTGDDIITFTTEIITLPGPTRNGVLYPLEEFKKAVEDPRVQDLLKRGAMYGECDHPANPEDLNRWFKQDQTLATHKWNKLWFDGDKLMGECQTYSGNGNLMWHAIKGGELPAFSIRVLGNPTQKGEFVELSDITLVTIDWVRYPGNPTSYVTSSDAFNIEEAPIYSGFDYYNRKITVGESAANILGISKYQDAVSAGKGVFYVVDKLDREDEVQLMKYRSSTF